MAGEGGATAKATVFRAKRVTHTKYVLDPEDAKELVRKYAKDRPDLAESPRRLYDFTRNNPEPGAIIPTKRDFQLYLNRPEPSRRGRRPRKSG